MAAPPESLHFQRNQAISERAPSALYSPDLSKRRTPVAKTASSGSMPASRIWINASPSVSPSCVPNACRHSLDTRSQLLHGYLEPTTLGAGDLCHGHALSLNHCYDSCVS